MKRLLNTLYITYGNRYLSLDGENVVVMEDKKEIGRIPLHNLQAIVTFGYTGASPALMGACSREPPEITVCGWMQNCLRKNQLFWGRV